MKISKRLVGEALGTTILVATVVGSGIMAQRLSGGNDAVALLGNTGATAAVLFVLISIFGPICGAQFNPVVTLLFGPRRAAILACQIAGAVAGTVIAHAMFGMKLLQIGTHVRAAPGELLGEGVATFGLLMTNRLGLVHRPGSIPVLVAAWITAGYWFTSSTSFANPAVTLARMLTTSFSGIRPSDVPAFIAAQCIGGFLGYRLSGWLGKEAQI